MLKNVRLAQRYPDIQNPDVPLVQCCVKSGKTISDIGGQEWPTQLATNIELVGRGCQFHYFCDWLSPKFKKKQLKRVF